MPRSITGVLPLATAVAAALALRQRPSAGFWACAVLGCALVLGFAAWQGGGALVLGRRLLLLGRSPAPRSATSPARGSSATMPAEQVICWVLVLQPAADAAGHAR